MTDRTERYEDALRNIAAATVRARRTPHSLQALQQMLCDVEHHLTSLIVLDAVPPPRRALPTPGGTCHCDGPPHPYDPSWCRP